MTLVMPAIMDALKMTISVALSCWEVNPLPSISTVPLAAPTLSQCVDWMNGKVMLLLLAKKQSFIPHSQTHTLSNLSLI